MKGKVRHILEAVVGYENVVMVEEIHGKMRFHLHLRVPNKFRVGNRVRVTVTRLPRKPRKGGE